jgi:phospholipid/cholesterol/gamma-HCH transport system substrate-binding protein
MARRNIAEVATGAAVLVVAAGFLAYAVAHSGRGVTSGYALNARFDRIDGLNVGADVRMAGVKVGAVTAARIDPQSFLAEVNFTVQQGLELPKDSSAEIVSDGLLGGKYLSLVPGGDTAVLKPNERVTITQSAVSLEQLLGKFIFSASELKNNAPQPDPPK